MRKLRADITLKEAWEWARAEYGDEPYGLIRDLFKATFLDANMVHNFYPDSFYESQPIGGFGKFWDNGVALGSFAWGYLSRIDCGRYVLGDDSKGFDNFEPGLPTDVDADGYPK